MTLYIATNGNILNSTDPESFTDHLDKCFTELMVKTKQELLRLDKSVDTVYRLLITQTGSGIHEHVLSLRGTSPKNFDDLFDDLNSYRSSSLEYELLEAIIKRNIRSQSLRKDMERYADHVKGFKRCTTVTKLVRHNHRLFRRKSKLKGHKNLKTRYELDPDKYTLETFDDFQRKVHTNSKCQFQLCHMEIGSVTVEWRILEDQEYALLVFFCGDVGKDLLIHYHVSDVSIDGYCVDESVGTSHVA